MAPSSESGQALPSYNWGHVCREVIKNEAYEPDRLTWGYVGSTLAALLQQATQIATDPIIRKMLPKEMHVQPATNLLKGKGGVL